MTVAVACNTPEGVILGVDSAITMNDNQGRVLKTYENAVKLFQLGDKPIGIATYGIGALGNRIIGTYLREFERQDPGGVVTQPATMEDTVEQLRQFFSQQYQSTVVPEIEARTNKRFTEIPDGEKPPLGLVVGGFSSEAYLSEVWQVLIPINIMPKSATLMTGQGDFRSSWYSLYNPIFRYHKGYDQNLFNDLVNYFVGLRGKPLTPAENSAIFDTLLKHEYQIPVGVMPMGEAIAYVKFLVAMVIGHHRFSVGPPVVGGKARIGLVSYRGEKFRILESSETSLAFP